VKACEYSYTCGLVVNWLFVMSSFGLIVSHSTLSYSVYLLSRCLLLCYCVHLVFLLKCAMQTYAWGKRGCNSEVARLMKNADNSFVIDDNTTYAEVVHWCMCWYSTEIFINIFRSV